MTRELDPMTDRPPHTPGPWTVDPDDPYAIVSAEHGGIGWVDNEPAENESLMKQARANARLIAAAPETAAELARVTAELSDADLRIRTLEATRDHALVECRAELARVTAERDALLEAARAYQARTERLLKRVDSALVTWARPDHDGLLEDMRKLDRIWEECVNEDGYGLRAAIAKAEGGTS